MRSVVVCELATEQQALCKSSDVGFGPLTVWRIFERLCRPRATEDEAGWFLLLERWFDSLSLESVLRNIVPLGKKCACCLLREMVTCHAHVEEYPGALCSCLAFVSVGISATGVLGQ